MYAPGRREGALGASGAPNAVPFTLWKSCGMSLLHLLARICCLELDEDLNIASSQEQLLEARTSTAYPAAAEPERAAAERATGERALLLGKDQGLAGGGTSRLEGTEAQHRELEWPLTKKSASKMSLADDEDACPTCLDPYTKDNPRVVATCGHHYHLPCIYEWLERSPTCPMCGRDMECEELLS